MRKGAKLIILGCLATIVAGGLVSSLSAQGTKIGYVNDEEIKLRYKAWQRAQEQWEIERNAWDDEALVMKAELEELITEYDKQKLILSDEKRKEREAAIRTKNESLDAFTRQIYAPGGTGERKQEQLVGPLLQNVTDAIKAVALEDGYDVIFTLSGGIGYIRETLDVTDKVLDALEKLAE